MPAVSTCSTQDTSVLQKRHTYIQMYICIDVRNHDCFTPDEQIIQHIASKTFAGGDCSQQRCQSSIMTFKMCQTKQQSLGPLSKLKPRHSTGRWIVSTLAAQPRCMQRVVQRCWHLRRRWDEMHTSQSEACQ